MAKLGINVLRGRAKNEIQLLGKELPGPIRFFSAFHCKLVPRAHVSINSCVVSLCPLTRYTHDAVKNES